MSVEVESVFTAALGLQMPWVVSKVELNTAKRSIDFDITVQAKRMNCLHCVSAEQGIIFSYLIARYSMMLCRRGGMVFPYKHVLVYICL